MGSRSFVEVLDTARWGRLHTILFTVVSLNYLLDGVMFSVAPLLLYLVAPAEVAATVFAVNLLAESLGAILLGWLADRVGRRVMFAASLALEVLGLAILAVDYKSLPALLVGTSLMTFGIGGEFGAAYAAIAEMVPARVRGKALMMATNFWNIGAALIAALSLVYAGIAESAEDQVRFLIASALGTAVVAGLARLAMPESPRWLVERGRAREAELWVRRLSGYTGPLEMALPVEAGGVSLGEALTRYLFRFSVLAVVTVAQYATYDLTAYYLPYAPGFRFGEEAVVYVVFYANLGASIGAFLLLPLIDRSRTISITSAFTGGLASASLLALAHWLGAESPFYVALLVNMVFSEWAWASLSVLQSELFPTGVRASVVGLLTSLQGITGAVLVYVGIMMNAAVMMASIITLWTAGLAASILWRLRGVESAKKSVEELVAVKA